MKNHIFRIFLLCSIAVFLNFGLTSRQQNSPAITKKVDVGGYKLNMKVMGEGQPAIILDSGLGEFSQAWAKIHPLVAGFAMVISYDRAGLGQSEPGPEPRSANQVAKELCRLLKNAEIPSPYVLVGHSLGGIHILTFASLYPDEVAGLVFVDAKDGTTFDAWKADLGEEQYDKLLSGFNNFYAKTNGAVKAEWESLKSTIGNPQKVKGLPDVPVVVLSSIRLSETEKNWGITPEVVQSSLGVHQSLAEQFPQGVLIKTEKSGHRIQDEEPELVVDSIRKVVDAVRKKIE